jgi:hypothetical protein
MVFRKELLETLTTVGLVSLTIFSEAKTVLGYGLSITCKAYQRGFGLLHFIP